MFDLGDNESEIRLDFEDYFPLDREKRNSMPIRPSIDLKDYNTHVLKLNSNPLV